MNCLKILTIFTLIVAVLASPISEINHVEEMRSPCNIQDPLGCIKMKAWSFFSSFFNKDNFKKITNFIEIKQNTYPINQLRNYDDSFEDQMEQYIKTHEVSIKLPLVDSTIKMEARNLDDGELDFKIQLSNFSEGRKSKLKKIALPIIAFVFLKAVILIPLALGIVGLKAWNAMQLSFVAFVSTIALAVYQLCKKIADDNAPPIAAHIAWDTAYGQKRSIDIAQKMAYSAYRK